MLRKYYDTAPGEPAGGSALIIKEIQTQGAAQKAAFEKSLTDTEGKLQKSIDDSKTELQNEISLAKGTAQKALEAAEETQKQFATVKSLGNPTGQTKSLAQAITDSVTPFTDDILKMSSGDNGRKKHIVIPIDTKAVGDMTVGNVTGGTVWGNIYRPGIIELPKRKVHLRNIFPGGNIGPGTDFYFMKQVAAGEGSIAFTAETGTKPQFDEDLVEASVKIEVLAGWSRITRKVMNNVPGFMNFLNSRMVERLYKAEDVGMLYGDGVSPNIKGILVSGNFTASVSTATIFAEKLIDDIAALEDTYEREANIIMLRPQHYYGFFKNKAAGSGEYDLPQNVVITNGQLYISGILAIPTTALNINTAPTPDTADYIVGDVNGANFLVQEGMRIELFEQDSTNVRENKITVRIEETVAFPIYGPNYFIGGTHAVTI